MPCDTFNDWEQNLRAIALTLHALRMVGQYGVTKHNEQYSGFKQIAAASKEAEREWAAKYISDQSGIVVSADKTDPAVLSDAYRTAARRNHPDSGGSMDAFVMLQKAKDILASA